jgi:hypothetical protein
VPRHRQIRNEDDYDTAGRYEPRTKRLDNSDKFPRRGLYDDNMTLGELAEAEQLGKRRAHQVEPAIVKKHRRAGR